MRKAVIVLSILILALMCSCKEPSDQVELVELKVENHSGYTIYWTRGGDLRPLADGKAVRVAYSVKDSSQTVTFYRVDGTYDFVVGVTPYSYPIIVEGPISKTVVTDTDKTLSIAFSGSMVISEI